MAIFDDIETVLTASAYYSNMKSPEMDDQQVALESIKVGIEQWLPNDFGVGYEITSIQASTGGRRGGIGPVPWVRIYSSSYSPRPTEGFYLVYLFAGDGSRVYLSLNQGTSERVPGRGMRPIKDPSVVRRSAADARQLFDGWSPQLMEGVTTEIDLAVAGLTSGTESKARIRNYEAANVYSLVYNADRPVSDQTMRADLDRMLELLRRVYAGAGTLAGADVGGSELIPAAGGTGQTRVADSRLRKAIEDYSMAVVMWLYAETGEWEVRDVSRFRSYDVELVRKADEHEVHVEVKGTRSAGDSVFLTKGEVSEAQNYPFSVLAVLHTIQVAYVGDEIICSGGQFTVLEKWTPAADALTPLQFKYQLPAQVAFRHRA